MTLKTPQRWFEIFCSEESGEDSDASFAVIVKAIRAEFAKEAAAKLRELCVASTATQKDAWYRAAEIVEALALSQERCPSIFRTEIRCAKDRGHDGVHSDSSGVTGWSKPCPPLRT